MDIDAIRRIDFYVGKPLPCLTVLATMPQQNTFCTRADALLFIAISNLMYP